MKVIICADGSEFSETSVDRFLEILSGTAELSIRVISVYEPPVPMATEPFIGSQDYYKYVSTEAEKLAKDYADKAQAKIKSSLPEARISTQIVKGKPERMIVEAAEEWRADLIVVGSHGYGFWGRALLGSVSDFVVHHASCSVLVAKK